MNIQNKASALSMKQLSYLIAVENTLSFTRAASQCFVTQSTLSGGIAELERVLGADLVERDRQRVMLTPLGQVIAQRAKSLLASAADLIYTAQAGANPLQGSITLGAIPTIAPFLLPKLLRAIRRKFPELRVFLREEQTSKLLEAVDAGEIDLALIALPMPIGKLQIYPLFSEELWLVGSTSEPLLKTKKLTTAGLDMPRLMLLGEGHCLSEHTLQACPAGYRGRSHAPSTVQATSLPTLVQMVEANLGFSLLPHMAIKAGFLTGHKVQAKQLASPAPQREICLVARATSPRTELFEQIALLGKRLN